MINKEARLIRIEENSLALDVNNILHVITVGLANEKIANAIRDASFKLINSVEGQVDVFIDINRSQKPTPEARKVWKELSEHERFRKIAIIGLHPVSRVLASFAIRSSRKKDFRFFKSKEDALVWLKE